MVGTRRLPLTFYFSYSAWRYLRRGAASNEGHSGKTGEHRQRARPGRSRPRDSRGRGPANPLLRWASASLVARAAFSRRQTLAARSWGKKPGDNWGWLPRANPPSRPSVPSPVADWLLGHRAAPTQLGRWPPPPGLRDCGGEGREGARGGLVWGTGRCLGIEGHAPALLSRVGQWPTSRRCVTGCWENYETYEDFIKGSALPARAGIPVRGRDQ